MTLISWSDPQIFSNCHPALSNRASYSDRVRFVTNDQIGDVYEYSGFENRNLECHRKTNSTLENGHTTIKVNPTIGSEESFQTGDRVKLILDKERSPDNRLHGRTGYIIDIEFDDASSITGDPEDNYIYTIQLDNREIPDIHFRRHDHKLIDED